MKYDVTIGIPMYQSANYISRALESALCQTYSDIEFLLVDDGSEDSTDQIVNGLKQTHPRGNDIRIIQLDENLGVSSARNKIIDEAQGEFLFFMDSDDVIREDTISLLMKHAKADQADVVFGSMEKVFPSGEKVVYQYSEQHFSKENDFANYAYRRYAGIQASACNFLVRVSLLREYGLRFYKSNYWEDMVFVLDLVTYVQRAVLLPDLTYRYLCRDNSLSNFQERRCIEKSEILRNVDVVEYMKQTGLRLRGKPYYPQRCYVAVMTDFYIACHILKRRKQIAPSISNQEIKAFLSHPASLPEILTFRHARLSNLGLFLLGRLPSVICVAAIWIAGKAKNLI